MDPLAAPSRNVDGFSDFGDTSHGNEHPFGEETAITKPVNVAYVLPGLGRGGTEKHVLDLASGLDRKAFTPFVISTDGDGPLSRDLTDRRIPVYTLHYPGVSIRPGIAFSLNREAITFFRTFQEILKKHEADIVHAYLPAANVLGVLAGSLAGVRWKIVSKRALCRYKEGHPVYSFLESLANAKADAIMVNSLAVAEDVRRTERFCERKIFLVYNGIEAAGNPRNRDPQPAPPDLDLPPSAVLVTYVANIREDKAHLCLVEAARTVTGTIPAARFLFVGHKGTEAGAVRERILDLGLEDRILLTGPRNDVGAILAASSVVAHPGEQEGFSNAILEAMAAGLPVVASRAGGNPETVADSDTGILVPPGDARAFAESILGLLRDPSRARELGEAGRRRAKELFSIKRMVESIEQTYRELMEGMPLSCRT
jgi:glycosyltransferase involved in cell wall biosynthesis